MGIGLSMKNLQNAGQIGRADPAEHLKLTGDAAKKNFIPKAG